MKTNDIVIVICPACKADTRHSKILLASFRYCDIRMKCICCGTSFVIIENAKD